MDGFIPWVPETAQTIARSPHLAPSQTGSKPGLDEGNEYESWLPYYNDCPSAAKSARTILGGYPRNLHLLFSYPPKPSGPSGCATHPRFPIHRSLPAVHTAAVSPDHNGREPLVASAPTMPRPAGGFRGRKTAAGRDRNSPGRSRRGASPMPSRTGSMPRGSRKAPPAPMPKRASRHRAL